MTFQKIEQMFDQNLIDYCNPPQNFLGGFEVNAHRCLTLFQYLQRSFLEIWVTYSSFYQLFGQMLVVKSAIYQYKSRAKKGCHMAKNGQY